MQQVFLQFVKKVKIFSIALKKPCKISVMQEIAEQTREGKLIRRAIADLDALGTWSVADIARVLNVSWQRVNYHITKKGATNDTLGEEHEE